MQNTQNTVPASLRKPIVTARVPHGTKDRVHPATLGTPGASSLRSLYSRLPKEGEDAKITGQTRSLDRRLLALNLRGSMLLDKEDVPAARIA